MEEKMSKSRLLENIHHERDALEAVLGCLSPAQMVQPEVESDWSVKDTLAHISAWETRMVAWVEESLSGKTPDRPSVELSEDDLNRINEQIYLENREKPLDGVLAEFHKSYQEALHLVETLTEADLFDPNRFAWRKGDPIWHMVADNTYGHYEEHRQPIENWMYLQLWSLAQETMRAFTPFYQEEMRKAIQNSGVPDHWFDLIWIRGCDPVPITSKRVHALIPYAVRARFVDRLEELAHAEMLERVGEDAYRLSNRGRETIEGILEAGQQSLARVKGLPSDEIEQLNHLLHRVVEASLKAPEPQEKWSMIYSRWTDPGEEAAEVVRTDQYLTDLARYRDDAHLAAWKPYEVSGQAWEALTYIWRSEAHTAEELVQKLPFRDHPTETYSEALEDLVTRGWAERTADGYHITEQGRAIRQEAEDTTNIYFFSPWSCLSEDEIARLFDLLNQLKDRLKRMAESPKEEAAG